MKKLLIFTFFLLFAWQVQAITFSDIEKNKTEAFKSVIEINDLELQVPTVVEVPINDESIERYEFAVFESSSNSFQPSLLIRKNLNYIIPSTVKSNSDNCQNLNDDDYSTYCQYNIPETGIGSVTITETGTKEITSSQLNIQLDQYVALPIKIEIKADDTIVYALSKMTSNIIKFPETKAKKWEIKLYYSQLLRISEFDLVQKRLNNANTHGLRFLARPTSNYHIYYKPDRLADINISTGESANISNNTGIKITRTYVGELNPAYRESDIDNDGITDLLDNCVQAPNADQEDIDKNGRGDICEDFDRDGILNYQDNCPDQPNRNQLDQDGDGIGDSCDGEESRLTEKYSWLPYLGIGITVILILIMFISVFKSKK
ncbi:hypothetical protein C0583_05770 [Candidatus Parcubacteria bacterium]|mgnify:CR=1 FL=1|nr:MAG: hypothetical protein C0583_05770 [Candidatus Parcubacteria bacterium]